MVSDLGFKSNVDSKKSEDVADNENGNTKVPKKAEKIVKIDKVETGKESQSKETSKEGNNKKVRTVFFVVFQEFLAYLQSGTCTCRNCKMKSKILCLR